MSERDYVLVACLTRLRAARQLVHDARPPGGMKAVEEHRLFAAGSLDEAIRLAEEAVERARRKAEGED